MCEEKITIEMIRGMKYAGGGYFRKEGPIGEKMPIIHAPEMRAILLAEIDRLNTSSRSDSGSTSLS